MKKTIIFIIYAFVIIIPFYVNAAMPSDKDFTVSCIYNDGKMITKSYDDIANTRYAEIKTYPVRNTKEIEQRVNDFRLLGLAATCSSENLCKKDGVTNGYNLQVALHLNYMCPNTFRRWLINEKVGEDRVNSLVYYYDWLTGGNYGVYDFLTMNNGRKWYGAEYSTNVHVSDLTPDDDDSSSQLINLVAERVTVLTDIKANKTCTYVHEAKQGSGSNKYITIYGYTDTKYRYPVDALKLYLDDREAMTSINEDKDKSIRRCNAQGECYSEQLDNAIWNGCQEYAPTICVKLSERELSQAEGSTEYTFSAVRHSVASLKNDGTCPTGYVEYTFSGYDAASNDGSNLLQICDTIPNTAIVLTRVLSWIQIIVPGLVIIYTGIDIGRIVIAGNLDEELPKKKKSIIIRFIIMATFFFIPFIIRGVLGTIYGVDVGAIDCLYENNDTE